MARIKERLVIYSSNTPLTNLTYIKANYTNNQRFICKKIDIIPTTEKVQGRLLNGVGFSHPKYTTEEITFTISADELSDVNSGKMDVLKAFAKDKYTYIGLIPKKPFDYAFDDDIAFNLFEVIVPPGLLPLTYLNDLKMFPEITFTVQRKGVI